MSMEMNVFFRGVLPSREMLTQAMHDLGFPFSITPYDDPLDQQKGFMPMRMDGAETGVEFDVFEGRAMIEDVVGEEIGTEGIDPSFDRSANFRWGGDLNEMLAGLCAAAALARLVNGIVFDTEGDLQQPEQAIAVARENLESVRK